MDVYLVAGARSPIGRFGGALLDRSGVPRAAVNRVAAGMLLQDMTESNPACIVGQRVGVPEATPTFMR